MIWCGVRAVVLHQQRQCVKPKARPEAAADSPGLDAGIETGLRNIHSTNDLHHGDLPCAYDCDQPTVRSCVTTAKVPGSPTVVAGGVSGDIPELFGRRPPAKALSRFHRTFCSMGGRHMSGMGH